MVSVPKLVITFPYFIHQFVYLMEQKALKNVNIYLNTNICSYLETSGGQSSNLYAMFQHQY
jgi:hypothetical protein